MILYIAHVAQINGVYVFPAGLPVTILTSSVRTEGRSRVRTEGRSRVLLARRGAPPLPRAAAAAAL